MKTCAILSLFACCPQTMLLTLSTSITVSFLDFFQGIERLQRREVICEEVKNALKPFYRHKEISKENYKYIFSRAAEKVGIRRRRDILVVCQFCLLYTELTQL